MPVSASTPLTVYRTPAEAKETITALVALIDGAQHSIHAMLYALTHPGLLTALERAHIRGVDVQLILDQSQSVGAIEAKDLHSLLSIIPPKCVRIGTATTKQIMHQKCAVVDGLQVITGSLNWTTRGVAEENDCLVIVSDTIAAAYEQAFTDLAGWIDQHEASMQLSA